MNPEDAEQLGIETGSIIVFTEPDSGFWGAAEVRKDTNVKKGKLVVDSLLLSAAGIASDDPVEVVHHTEVLQTVNYVEFGIKPNDESVKAEKILLDAEKKIKTLKKLLDGRLIFKGMEFDWPELKSRIVIKDTRPSLTGMNFARLSFEALEKGTGYQFRVMGIAVPFNAILMLDISGSMTTRDVPVKNIAQAIEGLKDLTQDEKDLQEFLEQFKEGRNVQRVQAAALAVLLYLAEKIGRGFGEKVSIITFESKAEALTFYDPETGKSNPYVVCTGEAKAMGLLMTSLLVVDKCNEAGQLTNMGDAFIKASEVMESFENPDKPVMLIMLSDGMPTAGPPPMEVIKEHFPKDKNYVIYTIGLGNPEEIDEVLLSEIAAYGRGTYKRIEDMGDLLVWYATLASDFSTIVRGAKSGA